MTQVVLHVGAPKCGSTYLQRVLLRERPKLRAQGVDYPHSGKGHPGNGLMLFDITRPWLLRAFEKFDTLVLSHELLFAQAHAAGRFCGLVNDLGISATVVTFLRPFDEIIFGDISQNLKQLEHGATPLSGRSFRQFVWARQKDIQPSAFVGAWETALPGAKVILAQHRSIHATMAELHPAFRTLNWSIPQWRSNPSWSMDTCEALMQGLTPQDGMDTGRSARRKDWINAVFDKQRRDLITRYGFDPQAPA